MGEETEVRFEVARDHEAGEQAPARESVWCVCGARRARIAGELAFGAGAIEASPVTHGFGLDVWDVGERLLARVAEGWHATDAEQGARTERFLASRDQGATWIEIDASDARDLEHRRTEESRVGQIDRWPASWC